MKSTAFNRLPYSAERDTRLSDDEKRVAVRPPTQAEIEAARKRLAPKPRGRAPRVAPALPPNRPRDPAEAARTLARLAAVELSGLLRDVARRYHVLPIAILSGARFAGAAQARHCVWYQIRNHSERHWSYPEIGALFAVDHTTVMAGVKLHAARLAGLRANVLKGDPDRCDAAAPVEPARCA